MNATLEAKNPFKPTPLVFTTATSAARNSALRGLVPVTTSEATGVPAAPFVMSTRTCVAPAAVNLMSKACPLATSL